MTADKNPTTYGAGDKIHFANGGEVVVAWVRPDQIGFSVWHPNWTDHRLLRMTHEDFDASLRISREKISNAQ